MCRGSVYREASKAAKGCVVQGDGLAGSTGEVRHPLSPPEACFSQVHGPVSIPVTVLPLPVLGMVVYGTAGLTITASHGNQLQNY